MNKLIREIKENGLKMNDTVDVLLKKTDNNRDLTLQVFTVFYLLKIPTSKEEVTFGYFQFIARVISDMKDEFKSGVSMNEATTMVEAYQELCGDNNNWPDYIK